MIAKEGSTLSNGGSSCLTDHVFVSTCSHHDLSIVLIGEARDSDSITHKLALIPSGIKKGILNQGSVESCQAVVYRCSSFICRGNDHNQWYEGAHVSNALGRSVEVAGRTSLLQVQCRTQPGCRIYLPGNWCFG